MAQGRAKLLRYARHQAALIYVNAWDHLVTLARFLGGDGAMPLFSQASLSRVVCEAAVRFAWLMDPDISSAKRIVRGAVALYYSADERSKGVRGLPPERFDRRTYQHMLDSCTRNGTPSAELITDAGLTFGYSRDGKHEGPARTESPKVSVPLKINVSELMAELLPDSPSWYNIGSSVTHSLYWGLRDVNHSRPGEPLALTPNVLDVGAAAESAISASALILDRCGRMNGHDPTAHIQRTKERREEVDASCAAPSPQPGLTYQPSRGIADRAADRGDARRLILSVALAKPGKLVWRWDACVRSYNLQRTRSGRWRCGSPSQPSRLLPAIIWPGGRTPG